MSTERSEQVEQFGPPRVRRAKNAGSWAGELTHIVGEQIRYWRRRRRLSVPELADRTKELGHHVPASVITNLEHDRRDGVALAEWLVLSAALNVPPILLVAPVGRHQKQSVLPDIDLSPWRFRGWILGALAPKHFGFSLEGWNTAVTGIRLYDRHRLLVQTFLEREENLRRIESENMEMLPGRGWPEDELAVRRRQRNVLQREQDFMLRRLVQTRRLIEAAGLLPPALPDELRDIVAQAADDERALGATEDAGYVIEGRYRDNWGSHYL